MTDNISLESLASNPFFVPGSTPPAPDSISDLVNGGISLVNVAGPSRYGGRVPGYDSALLTRQANSRSVETLSVALPPGSERGIDLNYRQTLSSRRLSLLPTVIHAFSTLCRIRSAQGSSGQPLTKQDLYVYSKPPLREVPEQKDITLYEGISQEGIDIFLDLISSALANHARKRRMGRKDVWQIIS